MKTGARLWQDVRFALRTFRKNVGFTVVALLSLTLGIGASIALFSVVYGVLIAPYPYARPNQIWAPAVLGPEAERLWDLTVGIGIRSGRWRRSRSFRGSAM